MIRGGLAFVAALVLAGLPAAFRWSDGGAFAVDGAVLVVLAVLLPRTERRAVPAVLAACWVLLLVFEGGMLGGRSTMGEDPVVYDGIQLLWHLGVVLQDLYGPWRFWGAVGAGLLATVALSAAAFFAFRLLVRGPWRVLPGGMAVLVGVAGVGVAGPHVATALAADRIAASVELYARVQGLRHSDAHARHMATRLQKRRPDVRIHVIESYGMVTFRADFARSWKNVVEANARRLEAAGWELASIRSDAPSTGGRSWICDASLLSGRQMHYQAEYAALTSDTDALDALPEWFRANGYETVLSRPSDRERPGVKNANHFHFDRTFFYADLDYRGPPVGWGRIPDQYAIGFLHANVFTGEGPQMSFTHLATSHYPWKVPPPYRSDWRAWQTEEEVLEPRENRTLANELWWVANQFKRDDSRVDRRIDSRQAQVYLATLEHPLRAIVDSMLDTPADRPTLVVILGDHQPPFLAPRNVYDVPMHLAANDPELLEQFLAEGAVPGWIPGQTRIQHATFYSWLIRGLAHYDGQARLPPLLVTGVEL